MKTTIEINDALLTQAREIAVREGSSLRSVVEEALRRLIDDHARRPSGFTLRDASVPGHGLGPDVAAVGWAGLVELAYEIPETGGRREAG